MEEGSRELHKGVGADGQCSPRHRMPFVSRNEGCKMRLMTWRALSISPYRGGAEWFGGALEVKAAEKAHARLKRMAAFESHDYDPTVGLCSLTPG